MNAKELYPLQTQLELAEQRFQETDDYENQVELDQLRDQVWEAQDELGGIVFRVPEPRLDDLRKKIEKMAKRCEKLGVAPPTVTDTGEREYEIVNKPYEALDLVAPNSKSQQEWAYVVVGGQPPRLAGWTFLATLQHEDSGTIVRRIPALKLYGEQRDDILAKLDLTQYRNARPVCDHCHTRRVRRDTYIVVHESGEVRQVGSNCLQDFTGGLSPQQAAKGFEYITKAFDAARSTSSAGFSGLTEEPVYETEEFLSHVALEIRQHGWVSRAKAEEWGKITTASLAKTNINNYLLKLHDQDGPLWDDPTEEDIEMGKAALSYARSLPGESDYEHNLKVALAGDHMKVRSAGLAASAVGIYKMKLDRENPKDSKPRLDEHYGQIKDRVVLTLTVEHIWVNEGFDSVYWTHVMRDAEGRTFKWYGSRELEVGKTYTGKWTIKDHRTDKYGNHTVINRPHGLEES